MALEDHNGIRPRKVLWNRTPVEVYQQSPRPSLDRDALYGQWEEYRDRLRLKCHKQGGIMAHELTVKRPAALAVLQEHGLVRCFRGRKPEDAGRRAKRSPRGA